MRDHRKYALPCWVLLTIVCCLPTNVGAATPVEVRKAIADAKTFIYSQQQPNGSFETPNMPFLNMQVGGPTALATYALLAGGESYQEPRIAKAIAYLETVDMKGFYALGMRAQVWTFLPMTPKLKTLIKRDKDLLVNNADKLGRYGYTIGGGHQHNSTSQYGVLGAWACAEMGAEIPNAFWNAVEKGWKACQGPDGGWRYESIVPAAGQATASMTAAGVASLFITQEYLNGNDGVNCTGNITNDNIENGLNWMAKNFDPAASNCYLLYGIERIGVASGRKYFGPHDWFQAGANALIRTQAGGSWDLYGRVQGTSLGILFLVRGSAPVAFNKLQYNVIRVDDKEQNKEVVANWNQRPRDVANLVHWIGDNLERDINWQVTNLACPVAELQDAPILYISGKDALTLKKEDKDKLREYVQGGGMILGQPDCANPKFISDFRKLGAELFPYKFRTLPADHVILTGGQFLASKWKRKPNIESMSNGVRELMIMIPEMDLGRSWQTRSFVTRSEAFEFGANLFMYAAEKQNLRSKGDTYVVNKDPKIAPDQMIRIARLKYHGNWDPEPAGWKRLANVLHNTQKIMLEVQTVEVAQMGGTAPAAGTAVTPTANQKNSVAAAQPAAVLPGAIPLGPLSGYPLAHLTGTGAFTLDPTSRAALKTYVDAGGTLFIDSAGGNAAFTTAARAEMSAIFGAAVKEIDTPLAADHPLYKLARHPVTAIEFRRYAQARAVGRTKSPRLRGLTIGQRLAVVFSGEDISTGLVGQPVDGVIGYVPESATALATNIVLYAAGQR